MQYYTKCPFMFSPSIDLHVLCGIASYNNTCRLAVGDLLSSGGLRCVRCCDCGIVEKIVLFVFIK